MKRLLTQSLIILLFAANLFITPQASANNLVQTSDFSTDELIIKYKKAPHQALTNNNLEQGFMEELLHKYKLKHPNNKFRKLAKARKAKTSSEIAVIKLNRKLNKTSLKKLVSKINKEKFLNANYEIEAVYPNYLYETTDTTDLSVAGLPNDPYYDKQTAYKLIKPEKLWKLTKGEGVVVAVIDSGVDYNHQDLAENIWVNPREIAANGIDDDGNGYVDDTRGWDFINEGGFGCLSNEDCSGEDNDPLDINGHGTHVSGLIAAVQNNQIGVSGIAPKAKIMPLKAAYSTGRSASLKSSDVFEAITYAINNNADVINMSFAGYELSVLEDIIKLANDVGIVVVAAAGNSGINQKIYPAAIDDVISVGSIEGDGSRASFSNYGDWVDIAAPGVWLLSTLPNNAYDFKSGTSMSAPLVAGLAALIKAKNKLHKLSPSEIRDKIIANSAPSDFLVDDNSTQYLGSISGEIQFGFAIDSLSVPAEASAENTIHMSASAGDIDSTISKFEWYSDQDGYLGSQADLQVKDLSLGSHVISVKAQNVQGEWSEPEFKIMEVVPGKIVTPNEFNDAIRFRISKRSDRLIVKTTPKNLTKIKAYKWISSKDGTIGTRKNVLLNNLTAGYHKISLSVQDADGNWSEPAQKVIEVRG